MSRSTTSRVVVAYITVLVLFAVLDGLWLGVIAMDWYRSAFADLLREPFITWPWLVFYAGYSMVVVSLAICPSRQDSVLAALGRGAMLGAAAYGAYNLTGYSIINGWPLSMMWVDWVWGTVATATLGAGGRWVVNRFTDSAPSSP